MSYRPAAGRILAVVAIAGALTAGACAEPAPLWRTGGPGTEPSPTPSASPRATELTFAFAGDVHFVDRTRELLDDPDSAVGPFAETLRQADFAMVNLETAVTERGSEQPKQYHFRTPPTAYAAVRAAGVDLVSIANNHTLDYGPVGLLDTLVSAKAASMPVVGAGRNLTEAYAPHFATVRGVKVGVVAFSQVHELAESWKPTSTRPGIAMAFDLERATAAVREARRQAEIVIVFMHWGQEGNSCPTGEMRTFARQAANAGADIVVGTHAHVLLADGWLDDTYVHYGLGNFVWYSTSRSTDTGVLRLTVRPGVAGPVGYGGTRGAGRRAEVIEKEFRPGVVSDTGQPRPVTGAARERVLDKIAQAARCTGLKGEAP